MTLAWIAAAVCRYPIFVGSIESGQGAADLRQYNVVAECRGDRFARPDCLAFGSVNQHGPDVFPFYIRTRTVTAHRLTGITEDLSLNFKALD